MTMTKVLRATILAGFVAIAVTAGMAQAAGRGKHTQKVSGTISFVSLVNTQTADQKLIADFQHLHPDITVKGQWFAVATTLYTTLAAQFQAGNAPDVVLVYGGSGVNPSMRAYAQAGDLVNLSKMPWAKRIPPSIKPLTLYKKSPYMWMMQAQLGIVMYNTDLFRQMGLKPPTTWGGLLNLCKTIRAKSPNINPLAVALGNSGNAAPILSMFANNNVFASNLNWTAKRTAGSTTFAGTAGWVKTFQNVLDLKDAGCLQPSAAADILTQTEAQFANGSAAMLIGPTFITGGVVKLNPNVNWSVFAPPGATAKATRMLVYPSQGFAVNAHSGNISAAEAFVNYAARQAPNALWAKTNGTLAPWDYQHKVLPPEYKPLAKLTDKAIAGWYLEWPTSSTFAQLGVDAQAVLTGQKSPAAAAADLDSTWGK
jgi:raffinose/stachyose/melibiose transport system substrate-binding protein